MTILEDMDEVGIRHQFFPMIDHRCEAIEQIFIEPPTGTQFLRHFKDGGDNGLIVGMNVGSPFSVILIDPVAERRE